jgi:hypothetical protein
MGLILFLDESGDHSLSKVDPQHPVFVLCGILMDENYHQTTATLALNSFKQSLFGRTDIILHTLDFTRNQSGFEEMKNHEFRERFFDGLRGLIQQLEFKIVACAIKKQEHLSRYGLNAIDPYILSLSVLLERFVFECGSKQGTVVAESRDRTLNNALELAFLDLKIRGTRYLSATKVAQRIQNLAIRKKSENLAGLQLADVVATPIARHVLGKVTYPKYSQGGDFFSVVHPKFRRDRQGNYEGMGLVVLPK